MYRWKAILKDQSMHHTHALDLDPNYVLEQAYVLMSICHKIRDHKNDSDESTVSHQTFRGN